MHTSPNEFHLEEVKFYGQQRTSASFRVQLGVDNAIREFARQNDCEASTVYRHAAVEYLRSRGVQIIA